MRVYKTPILTTEEQKVIGGKLSLRQFTYILVGGILAFSVAKAMFKLIGLAAILFFIVIFITALLLAFFKLRNHDLNLDKYLLLRVKFHFAQKDYKYGRG